MPPGARCLLLYPAGLDFVAAFLGCLHAGVVAVPAATPDPGRLPRAIPRLAAVVEDCRPAAVLTPDSTALAALQVPDPSGRLAAARWLSLDTGSSAAASFGTDAGVRPHEVAFLQYTSGSTGRPKGVTVTRRNLAHNLLSQHEAFRQAPGAQAVSWLPMYHDMGLLAGLLYPLAAGATATLMSPIAFVQRPRLWLEAVTRFGGTLSLSPDFGYQLCVRAVGDDALDGLDLSSWQVAVNGAEPVRRRTLDRFARRFAPAGFRLQALRPAYGLAEATLFVTSARDDDPQVTGVGAQTAEVSCGRPSAGTRVRIVDPDTAVPRPEGEVGEIWVRSPGNALGYWHRPEETAQTFDARLADGDGPYLRTGDLGVLLDGTLRVRGRIKDLVVLDGVNRYPQDIEDSTEAAHPAVRSGCVAAFAVDDGTRERAVVVAEARDGADDLAAVVAEIRRRVAEDHDVGLDAVVLVAPRSIAKTSSGKIQRGQCRDEYLDGRLQVRHRWSRGTSARSAAEVTARLVAQLALLVDVDPRTLDDDRPFSAYGLTSVDVVQLAAGLSAWLDRPVTPVEIYGHPTVASLARHLGAQRAATSTVPAPPLAAPPVDGPPADEPVAVIGIGCRFPGARGPARFWHLLAEGQEAIVEVPPDRWDLDAWFRPGDPTPGRMNTRRGGFLDDVTGFDAAFFGLSTAEARFLDPQQRLLLELTWEALEDAGAIPAQLAGTATGVFVGMTTGDYAQLLRASGASVGPYAATGNVACMASNRISYTYDFRGPSVTLDTACSSSLVAIHQACASLRSGESELALAGGVNLMLSPETTVALSQSGALSPRGRCHTFDARADGYVRGEGGALLLLKPISRAVADGDRVYAVVRGSAVNQDGRSNGLTAPSPQAHTEVMRRALRAAGLGPHDLRYVEAHGTGTALGDPIEASAVGMVVQPRAEGAWRCAIGSVKTNVGHLEAAAGVAGVTKVALALRHRMLPPSLHFATPNPHIDLDALGLQVQTGFTPWPGGDGMLVGGVNSFGVGGTNAHVVLAEAPPVAAPDGRAEASRGDGGPRLLVLSARTPQALTALGDRFTEFLETASPSLDEVCHTAAVRRTHHEHRFAVVATGIADLAQALRQRPATGVTGRAIRGPGTPVVFVFPGQGTQHLGMGRRLHAHDPAFREAFETCGQLAAPHLGWSLRAELLATPQESHLERDDVAQCLIFALQVSLAAAWRARGVEPAAVVGHSMGEVAAAHVAGALTLAEAVELTCVRAQLLASLSGFGAMAAVGMSRAQVLAELAEYGSRLYLAAANGPSLSVVSGEQEALAAFERSVTDRGLYLRRLATNGAGHSPVVDGVAASVAARFASLRPGPTTVPLYSAVAGRVVEGTALDGSYWAANLRQPVLFGPAVEQAAADGHRLFVELSPHPTLVLSVDQTLEEAGTPGHAVGSLVLGRDDRASMLAAFGALYAHGASVDLRRLFPVPHPVTSLPTAPWQRERVWFADGAAAVPSAAGSATDGPSADVPLPEVVRAGFAQVLRAGVIGPDDSFFELGGTSLMAAQLLHELRERLGRPVPHRLLFEYPTIRRLAAALESQHQQAAPERAVPLARIGGAEFPLTLNQERLLDEHARGAPGQGMHVITQHLLLEGTLDVPALEHSLRRVVEVHAGLRTRFVRRDGTLLQRLDAAVEPVLHVVDAGTGPDDREGIDDGADRPADPDRPVDGALRARLGRSEREIDPFEGPLARFELHPLDARRHVLSLAVHHTISDGWSQGVLVRDLIRAYRARLDGEPDGLEAPPVRMVDVAARQRGLLSGDRLQDRMDAWRRTFETVPAPRPRFVLPPDRRDGRAVRARLHECLLPPDDVERLEAVARGMAATVPMATLAAFVVALRNSSGQDHLAVPISTVGRDQPQLDDVVGFLSAPRLVAVDLAGSATEQEVLRLVRDAVVRAGEEQDLSFSEYGHLAGLTSQDIPYRISMNYLPEAEVPDRFGPLRLSGLPRQTAYNLSRDILLIAHRSHEGLRLSFGYAAGVVDDDGVRTLAEDMLAFCRSLGRSGSPAKSAPSDSTR